MSKIRMETLTSVHVGSGVFLQKGSDFVYGKNSDGEPAIAIVNSQKVLNLIGEEHINDWVIAIERGRTVDEIIKQYAGDVNLEDFAQRVILLWTNKRLDTLKEFLHDGMGKPYIPGSSIKGAIRTAVLASVAKTIGSKENKIEKKNNYKSKFSADVVEAEAFGKDPKQDVFRFLRIGDAFFGKSYEAAVRLVNINERQNNSFFDESKHQLVEVLTPEDTSTFDMKMDVNYYNECKRLIVDYRDKVHDLPECMMSLPKLFSTINNHTLSLVESEIDYWEERRKDENAGEAVDEYLDSLKNVMDEINSCKKDEGMSCVLRIGHGSGWRFITGAWTESLNNFNDVIAAARPNNSKYKDYYFPKSRRMDDEYELLGFVRLTILNL